MRVTMIFVLGLCSALAATLSASAPQVPPRTGTLVAKAERLHADSFVYDSHLQRVLAIGAEGAVMTMHADGWLIAPGSLEGPAPRFPGGAVFDAARRRVLFCQSLGTTSLTWNWSGGRWQRLRDDGAQPGPARALAYDSNREVVVLVDTSGGTWEQDGVRWRRFGQLAGQQSWGKMAFDELRQVCVLVDLAIGSVNEWDGQQWLSRGGAFAPGVDVSLGAVTYDPIRQRVLVTGSCHQTSVFTINAWDGVRWTQLPCICGSSFAAYRCGFASWFDLVVGQPMFAGGFETIGGLQDTPDIWSWNGTCLIPQRELPTPIQIAYWFHDPLRGRIVAVEDLGAATFPISKTWLFDPVTGSWTLRATSTQAPRFGRQVAAFDSIRGETLVWSPGQLVAWTGTDWSHRGSNGPAYGVDVAMAFDSLRGNLVLRRDSASVWQWNGTTWSQRPTPNGPSTRSGAAMAFDPRLSSVVLFGGVEAGVGSRNDTWAFDGTQWTQIVTPQTPPTLAKPSLRFDPVRQQMVLLGQSQGSEFWALDAAGWQPTGRHDRPFSQLLWDPSRQSLMMLRELPSQDEADAVYTWTPWPALAKAFGRGCGRDAPTLVATTAPRLGSPLFGVELLTEPAALVTFGASTMRAAGPSGDCPNLLAGAVVGTLALANARGLASWTVPLPLAPTLLGLDVFAQAGVFTAGTARPVLTPGLWFMLGD